MWLWDDVERGEHTRELSEREKIALLERLTAQPPAEVLSEVARDSLGLPSD